MEATRPVRIVSALVRRVDGVTLASVCALTLALGAVLLTTLALPLKDNVAWLLHVARDLLHGRHLYVDVIEINPPLIIWLSAIPVIAADLMGTSAGPIAVALSAAAMLACAWWCAALLRGYLPLLRRRAPVFAVVGITLLAVPGVELGEREHLLIACALPYLCLLGLRLAGRGPSTRSAIPVGVLAGVGCALKPGYTSAFALLEAVAWWRGLRPSRPEVASLLAVLLAYGVAVAALCPEYIRTAVPLALALYGASDVSLSRLLGVSLNLLLGEAVAIGLLLGCARPPREDALFLTLVVFGCGATLTFLVEGKEWFYHRIPAMVAIGLALAYRTAAALLDRGAPTRHARLALVAAACALGAFGHAALERLMPRFEAALAPEMTIEGELERLIRREHPHSYMAFSQLLSVAFPLVDDVGAAWTSRFDSMWALRGELWRAQRNGGQTPSDWPVRRWVTADFLTRPPDLVVVDDRDRLDYIGMLEAANDPFARAWTEYRQIAVIDGLRVFKRTVTAADR